MATSSFPEMLAGNTQADGLMDPVVSEVEVPSKQGMQALFPKKGLKKATSQGTQVPSAASSVPGGHTQKKEPSVGVVFPSVQAVHVELSTSPENCKRKCNAVQGKKTNAISPYAKKGNNESGRMTTHGSDGTDFAFKAIRDNEPFSLCAGGQEVTHVVGNGSSRSGGT